MNPRYNLSKLQYISVQIVNRSASFHEVLLVSCETRWNKTSAIEPWSLLKPPLNPLAQSGSHKRKAVDREIANMSSCEEADSLQWFHYHAVIPLLKCKSNQWKWVLLKVVTTGEFPSSIISIYPGFAFYRRRAVSGSSPWRLSQHGGWVLFTRQAARINNRSSSIWKRKACV